jgi:hypothetical protein
LLPGKYETTFALRMMFLLGIQAMFGQDPPIYLRSMTTTRFPSPAMDHAASVDPVPPEDHKIVFFRIRIVSRLG